MTKSGYQRGLKICRMNRSLKEKIIKKIEVFMQFQKQD